MFLLLHKNKDLHQLTTHIFRRHHRSSAKGQSWSFFVENSVIANLIPISLDAFKSKYECNFARHASMFIVFFLCENAHWVKKRQLFAIKWGHPRPIRSLSIAGPTTATDLFLSLFQANISVNFRRTHWTAPKNVIPTSSNHSAFLLLPACGYLGGRIMKVQLASDWRFVSFFAATACRTTFGPLPPPHSFWSSDGTVWRERQ